MISPRYLIVVLCLLFECCWGGLTLKTLPPVDSTNDSNDEYKSEIWNYPDWFFSTARFNPGGPTFYNKDNRLVAYLYLEQNVLIILATAITFALVFIVIFPIIKHRLHSTIVAVHSLCVGLVIAFCLICPEWLTAHGLIQSPIHYYNNEMYEMSLGIYIGLTSLNVTLESIDRDYDVNMNGSLTLKPNDDYDPWYFYNEKVSMIDPEKMYDVIPEALEKGLPIPILTVYDCLTANTEGFEWSQAIIESGYHCHIIMLMALIAWFYAQLFIAAIPRYGSYTFIVIGVLLTSTCIVYFYWAMISAALPCIVISEQFIELEYGRCYWMCLITGIWSLVYGFAIAVYDIKHPDKFLTIFDLDYDEKRSLARAHRFNASPAPYSNRPYGSRRNRLIGV